ncbi:hypothetical protein GGE12_006896 [Rhizobium mongolense]|uniref:Uncharacterized protein n=1 Tax=Rhizobium mongolense TaxID=57676 RepID=A0A7W6WIS2_9HYPH|nr:hypothetical protein [Rhizobium mongolense]
MRSLARSEQARMDGHRQEPELPRVSGRPSLCYAEALLPCAERGIDAKLAGNWAALYRLLKWKARTPDIDVRTFVPSWLSILGHGLNCPTNCNHAAVSRPCEQTLGGEPICLSALIYIRSRAMRFSSNVFLKTSVSPS